MSQTIDHESERRRSGRRSVPIVWAWLLASVGTYSSVAVAQRVALLSLSL